MRNLLFNEVVCRRNDGQPCSFSHLPSSFFGDHFFFLISENELLARSTFQRIGLRAQR